MLVEAVICFVIPSGTALFDFAFLKYSERVNRQTEILMFTRGK